MGSVTQSDLLMTGVKTPKHVEEQLISNKSLLLHLVGLTFIYYANSTLASVHLYVIWHKL